MSNSVPGGLHHVEIYVSDLQTSIRFWEPLLMKLGYAEFQKWELGASFLHGTTYIVFVQVEPAHSERRYHRKSVGLNHLAFHAASREQVDEITEWMRDNGYNTLYEDHHPHAVSRKKAFNTSPVVCEFTSEEYNGYDYVPPAP